MKKGIIYEWRNKLDGKFYVGQTIRPKGRYKNHVKAQGDSVFHRAIRLHGIENFEYTVVATYEHETEQGLYDLLNEAEKERIKFRNSLVPNGYNVAEGGKNGNTLSGMTEEEYVAHCNKISNLLKGKFTGENNPMYGKKQSDESKEKNRQSHLGKHYSDDTRKKHSENAKGEKNPMKRPEVRAKHSDTLKGEKNPSKRPEVRDKLSKATKGMKPVNNGIECKKIHVSKIDEFLANNPGWVCGYIKKSA